MNEDTCVKTRHDRSKQNDGSKEEYNNKGKQISKLRKINKNLKKLASNKAEITWNNEKLETFNEKFTGERKIMNTHNMEHRKDQMW